MARKYLSDEELQQYIVNISDEESLDSKDEPDYNASATDTSDSDSENSTPRHNVTAPGASASPPDSSPKPATSGTSPNRSPAQGISGSPQNISPVSAGTATAVDSFEDIWSDPAGKQQHFNFNAECGMDPTISGILALTEPIDYFSLFFNHEIINIMVNQTNLFATQYLERANDVPSSSRLHDWMPTDANEMKQFVGLLGWMSVVKVPELPDYWSQNPLFSFPLSKNTMPRNRFELLLRFWHFANNDEATPGDRTHKINAIFNEFIKNFKNAYTPGETICI
ncbi:unnamed protein product [Acanthoscelides obtectus]|uniref:PiggyBac transposable element-derived protein domain-containing protein n=1 Tax=Acanthoscelides obtectus TaxID=200917 RepID=A0A9P0K4Z1_ACAOB|nr:unnamed protein product [Acanthoscelides obtectus]CAK1658710.1 PiggyBac transposable element-derived protein 4 [Acanthoscelides obtectus]